MKKVLSLVLVLVLALGSFSFATPSDVVGTTNAGAVDRLMSLNILTGYPDGTFKPANTITRAEFAAVVVRSLGLETAASVSSPTKFADVPASHWASGYISVASGLGVINGYTNGKFGPSDPVTYEQAIAMVIRALGYEPQVASKGGYPTGGLIIASELGLLDGVVGTVGAPAPRGLVAMLVDNALEVDLMEQVMYGDEIRYQVAVPAKSLLTDKLGLTKASNKTVTSVDTDKKTMKLSTLTTKFDVAPGVTLTTGLENLDVTAWYKNDTIYVLTVNSKVYYDFVDDTSTSGIDLLNTGEELDFAATYAVYEDGILDSAAVADDYNDLYGKIIVNDDDEITRAELFTIAGTANGIVSDITATKVSYDSVAAAAARTIADIDDMDFEFVVIDGKAATVTDLKAGMFIQYIEDTSNFDNVIVANTNKIEGVFNSVTTNASSVKIGGTSYDLGTAYFSLDKFDSVTQITSARVINDELDDLDGTNVVAYKDNMGDVVLVVGDVEDTTTSFYGFLKTADTFTEKVKVNKVVDGDVETVTYAYDLDTTDETLVGTYQTSGVAYISGTPATNDFFEFTVDEDNVITDIAAVTDITSVTTAAGVTNQITDVNGTNDTMLVNSKYYYVADDMVVYTLLAGEIDITTWADLVAADVTNVNAYIEDSVAGNRPGVMIIFNDPASQLDDSAEDYFLAYADDAADLVAGKYTATVKTNAGDLAVVVDDSDAEIWVHDYSMVVLQLKSNGEYDAIVSATPDFVTTGALTSFTTFTGSAFSVVNNGEVVDVDGQYITIGATEYRVASNALIYRQYDVDDMRATDLGAIVYSATASQSDNATIIIEDGLVKLLIFKR